MMATAVSDVLSKAKKQIEAKLEKFAPSGEEVTRFCDSIKDDNLTHRSEQEAKKRGFPGRIVPGTYCSALGEVIANEMFYEIPSEERDKVSLIAQRSKLSKPIMLAEVFAPRIESWESEGKLHIKTTLANEKATVVSVFGSTTIPEEHPAGHIYDHTFKIADGDIDGFYTSIRQIPPQLGPNYLDTFGEALGPSGLLKILEILNKEHKTDYGGMNRGMDTCFHGVIHPGNVMVRMYNTRDPERLGDNSYRYVFKTKVMQDGVVKAVSTVRCITDGTLDLATLTKS